MTEGDRQRGGNTLSVIASRPKGKTQYLAITAGHYSAQFITFEMRSYAHFGP